MIHITSDVGRVSLEIQQMAEDMPQVAEAYAEDALYIMTEIPKKYIPAAHRKQSMQRTTKTATGRLWSGWGARLNVQTNNPASGPGDNIAVIKKTQGAVEVEVGTNIRYAHYVDYGLGRGYHPLYLFSERGGDEIEQELKRAEDYYMKELTSKDRQRIGASIRSRRRIRTTLGRFA